MDSPGGEVAGCFDLVDEIYHTRGSKPIHSILTKNAYSAAYAIASAADRIHVPRTGGVGSLDDGSTINTTKPVLGVRDSQFQALPKQGDRVFIGIVGGVLVNTLFAVADVQPDSHGGTKLILNKVR
ncbi:MAG: hypothetical protein G5702_04515 [Serratia symbiotica]|nr:hypothetical protein [Serratia symbiotica]